MTAQDMELVREYAAHGSEEAFAVLVSRHVNLVNSVALRQLRDPHLAEEVTQAAFIILARKAGSLGPKTILSAWLCRTAHYVAADALRTQCRRQGREQELYMQSFSNSIEPDSTLWTSISPLLDGALAGLREKEQSAIVLRFYEGKGLKEVGAELGISENAATKRVGQALEKLRRYFSRHGVSSTAAIIAGAISTHSVQAAPGALAQSVTVVALTKGGAASVSTLALSQGALKMMAWAKMKIVLTTVAGVAAGVAGLWTTHLVVMYHDPAKVDGLIGWWKLNDRAGIVAKETSHLFGPGNGNGKLVRRPKRVSGPKGGALQFNGKGQYVDLGTILTNAYNELSIACWVKRPGAEQQLDAAGTAPAKFRGASCVERARWDDEDGIGLIMDQGGEAADFGHFYHGNFAKSKTVVQDDQWHHVAGTMAPSGDKFLYSIYVDGKLDNTQLSPMGLKATDKGWAIGARYLGNWSYQGAISDVRFYDHALTAAEVRKIFED